MIAQIVALEQDQEAAAARGENRTFLPLPTPATPTAAANSSSSGASSRELLAQDRNIVDEDEGEDAIIREENSNDGTLNNGEIGTTNDDSIFGFLGGLFGGR